MLGLLHSGVVLLLVLAAPILIDHVQIRFGFRLPRQKLGIMLLLSTCCLTVDSSVLAFPRAWERVVAALDLTSLAMLLAGIAAFGAVAQQPQRPVVYTSANPSLNGLPGVIIVPPDIDHPIRFYIHNCSHITAEGVVVPMVFSPQVRVLAVHTPTPSFITDDGHGLAVHLESDTSHNPTLPPTDGRINVRREVNIRLAMFLPFGGGTVRRVDLRVTAISGTLEARDLSPALPAALGNYRPGIARGTREA